MSCLITMSQKELHRLEVIQKINDRRLSVVQAAELLGLSRSQVHRLLQAYDRSGAAGLVSKKRGRPSNRRHSEEFRNAALDLIRERYLDFGPTLAREKLIELHRISLSSHSSDMELRIGMRASSHPDEISTGVRSRRRESLQKAIDNDGLLLGQFSRATSRRHC
ncbi:hypothetical protein BHMPCIPO_03772 [Ensifer sesbaniae]|nr:hypothetical protein [Ensifer sesbaniae]